MYLEKMKMKSPGLLEKNPLKKCREIPYQYAGIKEGSTENNTLSWLLEGDISIQYQTCKDLLDETKADYRVRIAKEGWGEKFLDNQHHEGHWGEAFYQPKWISSHYTLLDLRNLELEPGIPQIDFALDRIFENEKGPDGGIRPIGSVQKCDVCINGMFLNYACFFGVEGQKLESVVDFILSQKMIDGGFNCMLNRSGARHSSLHSTISVSEGICEYRKSGYTYRLEELLETEENCREFILLHRLFLSDRTGKVIRKEFIQLPYPWRWRFNILRGLEYFRKAGVNYDERMAPAIDVLLSKRRKDRRWNLNAHHPGQTHFDMEKAGTPSRWNTLNALRILKHFDIE